MLRCCLRPRKRAPLFAAIFWNFRHSHRLRMRMRADLELANNNGDLAMRANGILRFTQRALWIYIVEAVCVLGIVLIFRAFS
jgi:hypothetical protein